MRPKRLGRSIICNSMTFDWFDMFGWLVVDRKRSARPCLVLSGCSRHFSVLTCVYPWVTRRTRRAVLDQAERNCSSCHPSSSSARPVRTSGRTCRSGTRSRFHSTHHHHRCSPPSLLTALFSPAFVCLLAEQLEKSWLDRFRWNLGRGQSVDTEKVYYFLEMIRGTYSGYFVVFTDSPVVDWCEKWEWISRYSEEKSTPMYLLLNDNDYEACWGCALHLVPSV